MKELQVATQYSLDMTRNRIGQLNALGLKHDGPAKWPFTGEDQIHETLSRYRRDDKWSTVLLALARAEGLDQGGSECSGWCSIGVYRTTPGGILEMRHLAVDPESEQRSMVTGLIIAKALTNARTRSLWTLRTRVPVNEQTTELLTDRHSFEHRDDSEYLYLDHE